MKKLVYIIFSKNIKDFKIKQNSGMKNSIFEDSLKRFNKNKNGTLRKRNFFIKIFKKLNSLFNKYQRKD